MIDMITERPRSVFLFSQTIEDKTSLQEWSEVFLFVQAGKCRAVNTAVFFMAEQQVPLTAWRLAWAGDHGHMADFVEFTNGLRENRPKMPKWS